MLRKNETRPGDDASTTSRQLPERASEFDRFDATGRNGFATRNSDVGVLGNSSETVPVYSLRGRDEVLAV
jgi:hypothetical protein